MTLRARVVSPPDLRSALAALDAATERSCILAGGTDLVVEFQNGRTTPDLVVDVGRVAELGGIRVADGGLRIGARTTCTELLREPSVATHADILVTACEEFGAVQIRNRATVGGNLGTASPAADLNPVLLALDATVRLASTAGRRDVPVGEFLTGYRSNARRPDELIESVWIPPRPTGERRAFRKVGTRAAQSISKVVVALALELDGGRIVTLRTGVGSVAPGTRELPTLRTLIGTAPSVSEIRTACRATVTNDVAPIDDVRSTAGYRREVLVRVLQRMLTELCGA